LIRWQVERWRGGVVWVDVSGPGWRHRLQGMDHYWVAPPRFGSFNTTPAYEGRQVVAYEATSGGCLDLGEVLPPKGVEVLDGIQMPDDVARGYGLLP